MGRLDIGKPTLVLEIFELSGHFPIYSRLIAAVLALSFASFAEAKSDGKLLIEGKKLLSDGRSREAEDVLRRAVAADGKNLSARLQYGICLYQLGRYWGALSQLEKIIETDRDNGKVYLYLGHCYVKTGKIKDAVVAYENFLELSPDTPDQEKYKTLVGVLKTQAAGRDKQPASASGTASGDYMKEATETGLFRWPDSRMPITVYIEPADSVPGYRPEFDDCLRHAFREWTTATNGKVKFDIVSNRDGAAMVVAWTDDMHAPELKAEAGKASVVQDADGIKSADVKLLTVSPWKEGPLGCELLYNICLHEIGHALGILGHSPYPEDIMYPLLSTQTGITPRDVRTLNVIYAAGKESLAVASADSGTTSDQSDFDRLSPKIQAELLLKAGTKACFAGNYEDSISKLDRVLKVDPDNALARSNLAVAANNLAVKTESQDARLKLLHKALFWNPDSAASRTNLGSVLGAMGVDANDAASRIKLADKMEKSGDIIGACVELSEALRIKPDPTVEARLDALRKSFEETDETKE